MYGRDWDWYVDSMRERFGTVPDIFDYVWRRYQSVRAAMGNTRRGSFFVLDVTYNAEHHFPEGIFMDTVRLGTYGGGGFTRMHGFRVFAKF